MALGALCDSLAIRQELRATALAGELSDTEGTLVGSCFFLQANANTFLITCDHVVAELLRYAKHGFAKGQGVGITNIASQEWKRDRSLDIAILRLDQSQIPSHVKPLKVAGLPQNPIVAEDKLLFFNGYPWFRENSIQHSLTVKSLPYLSAGVSVPDKLRRMQPGFIRELHLAIDYRNKGYHAQSTRKVSFADEMSSAQKKISNYSSDPMLRVDRFPKGTSGSPVFLVHPDETVLLCGMMCRHELVHAKRFLIALQASVIRKFLEDA